MTIHWCGTGLSAVPGLRRLIEAGHEVTVWNRTPEEAAGRRGRPDRPDRGPSIPMRWRAALKPPATSSSRCIPPTGTSAARQLACSSGRHFVSSSYIAPEMRALDDAAREAGVAIVNEVGLDPGIDHLMAHRLVADYRASQGLRRRATCCRSSYCGGVPKARQRLPLQVQLVARWGAQGAPLAVALDPRLHGTGDQARPWDAVTSYDGAPAQPETFEVYPNRDAAVHRRLPLRPGWRVKDFVRGTLRLNGWADAWAPVFDDDPIGEGRRALKALSDRLWRATPMRRESPTASSCASRSKAEREGRTVWHKTWALDAWGDVRGSAMARLVSGTVALAVEAVLNARSRPGSTARRRTRGWWPAGSRPSIRWRSTCEWWITSPDWAKGHIRSSTSVTSMPSASSPASR
jgi:hypothetical protein